MRVFHFVSTIFTVMPIILNEHPDQNHTPLDNPNLTIYNWSTTSMDPQEIPLEGEIIDDDVVPVIVNSTMTRPNAQRARQFQALAYECSVDVAQNPEFGFGKC